MAEIVRVGMLWGYGPLVECLGGDPDGMLDEAGLESDVLSDPDRFIARAAAVDLLERAAERLGCASFGLRLAEMQDIYVLGPLAFAIRNAPDLRSAVRTAARRLYTQAPAATLTLQSVDGGDERIVYQGGLDSPAEAVQTREHTIGFMCRTIGLLTQGAVKPARVQLRHAPTSSRETYRERLGVEPEFGADADAICIKARDMCAPIPDADQQLLALVERYLATHVPLVGEGASQHVHHVLFRLMRDGEASMSDVAHVLRVHPRTLQRKLAAAGTSFEKVRDGVRRDLAEAYLAHELIPLAHVAHLLGYADQSVLTRSCQRWFGKTPMEIRRDAAQRTAAEPAGATQLR